MKRFVIACISVVIAITTPHTFAAEPVAVAVLNFANQAQGPAGQDWDWLEKGLADLIINDLSLQKGLLLVDRERMQETLTAEGIPITPGMDLSQVRLVFVERFKVARLVFGSYRVDGDKITLNASVMDAYTGRLIKRLQVAGAANDVLKLQKKLASQIIAVLLGRADVEQIASSLPVWTESLPASKLLYTAIDKFDQGQFSQAWLYARRAWRVDPAYADALYWVGRMHYYMLQYPHARRYFEQFVYKHTIHPRIGDAVLEYIDTFERTAEYPSEMIQLYEDMLRKTPQRMQLVNVFSSIGMKTSLGDWLKYQLGYYYVQNTEYARTIRLIKPTLAWGREYRTNENDAKMTLLKTARAKAVNELSAVIPLKEKWQRYDDIDCIPPRPILFCRPGSSSVDLLAAVDGWWDHKEHWPYGRATFAAPPGYVFGSAEFETQPAPNEKPHVTELYINYGTPVGDSPTYATAASRTRSEQSASGCTLKANLPISSGVFSLDVRLWVNHNFSLHNHPRLRAFRAQLKVEPISPEPTGAIDLHSPGSPIGSSTLDGRPLLAGEGMVLGVPIGSYTLRIARAKRSYSVEIGAGRITTIRHLAMHADDLTKVGWSKPTFISEHTRNPVQRFSIDARDVGKPQDHHLVRGQSGKLVAVWACDDDLWLSTSDNLGDSWNIPEQLTVPVNSAHTEERPSLGQLSDGRWVLLFVSDRFIPRRKVLYACWSWDLKRWSSPRMILDYSGGQREYEIWPRGGNALLTLQDGRVGMQARYSALGSLGLFPALIFVDPLSGGTVSNESVALPVKNGKFVAKIWGLTKDSQDRFHLFSEVYHWEDPNGRDGGNVFYMEGQKLDNLQESSAPTKVLEQHCSDVLRSALSGPRPVIINGETFLCWLNDGYYYINRPIEVDQQLRFETLAKIPAPGLAYVPAVQIGNNMLGFVATGHMAGQRAIMFQKLDLAKALTKEEQKTILDTEVIQE